jgi:hypothetical protein
LVKFESSSCRFLTNARVRAIDLFYTNGSRRIFAASQERAGQKPRQETIAK